MPVAMIIQNIILEAVINYQKEKIKSALEKYCETEKADDFGELLMALEPMIKVLLRKWWKYSMYHEDMIQEIFRILIKKHSEINRCKLLKLKANSYNGDGFDLSAHYYNHIRGLMSNVSIKIDTIFFRDSSAEFWWQAESWVGNMTLDESGVKFERGEE